MGVAPPRATPESSGDLSAAYHTQMKAPQPAKVETAGVPSVIVEGLPEKAELQKTTKRERSPLAGLSPQEAEARARALGVVPGKGRDRSHATTTIITDSRAALRKFLSWTVLGLLFLVAVLVLVWIRNGEPPPPPSEAQPSNAVFAPPRVAPPTPPAAAAPAPPSPTPAAPVPSAAPRQKTKGRSTPKNDVLQDTFHP
jgi:hypothetical protein